MKMLNVSGRLQALALAISLLIQQGASANPLASESVAEIGTGEKIIHQVPAKKTLSALGTHIKAIEFSTRFLRPMELEYSMGPTADPVRVKRVIDRFAQKLKKYRLVGLEGLDMDWVLISENDYEWWREYRLSQDPDWPADFLWPSANDQFGHCTPRADVLCGAGNEVNGKDYQDNIVGTRHSDHGLHYVTRHEAAHFYQSVFGYGGSCWFAEGQATFFETYLETTSRSRNQVLTRFRNSPAGVAKLSEEEIITKIQNNSVCDRDPDIAYDMGMLAFEYLYLNYSFAQIHELMVVSSQRSWADAAAEVLGIEAAELDAQIGSYVYSALD